MDQPRVHDIQEPPRGAEHILACLSTSPSNARIIRTAATMAAAFGAAFTAVFVETPAFAAATPEDKRRLEESRALARRLGASVETVWGDDIAYQIAEFARLSGVTKIILGRSVTRPRHFPGRPALTEQLLSYAPEVDIHIIPDNSALSPRRPAGPGPGILRQHRTIASAADGGSFPPSVPFEKQEIHQVFLCFPKVRLRKNPAPPALAELCGAALKYTAVSAGILLCATGLSILFDRLGFTDANIIMVYILGVLLISVLAPHPVYSLVTSAASVLIFNFLFTVPRFSLRAYGTGYPVTFVIMFLTAYITGTLALRCKRQARQSARIAHRTKILFDTDRLLAAAGSREEIIRTTARQLVKLLERDVVVFENREGALGDPRPFRKDGLGVWQDHSGTEGAAARWALDSRRSSGAATEAFPQARYSYFALRVNERVYGVAGVRTEGDPLDASEHSILLSILGEAALALENEQNAREKEAAAVRAEREQLRADLLRTISHDLRTPLTTISGNAGNLLRHGDGFDAETRRRLYADIYDDAVWLTDLVENLLYATRIEDGRMTLRLSTELLSELIEEAVGHMRRKTADHPFSAVCEEELLLVRADARLVVQVITNIIDNAVKYTRPGTPITLRARRSGDMAEVLIADEGDGVTDEEKRELFQKFYRGRRRVADGRRSLGLGLYLCSQIVQAHGGAIRVEDNQPRGAVFRFTLPLEEAADHA